MFYTLTRLKVEITERVHLFVNVSGFFWQGGHMLRMVEMTFILVFMEGSWIVFQRSSNKKNVCIKGHATHL